MRYRTLGATGIQVAPYALGTMNFGSFANPDHDACARIVHRALDAGMNLIDTADVYSGGESERIVGAAIRGRRDEVVLATKFSNPMGDDPNRRGGSRRWIVQAVEASLRRLDTDRIDLYQYHYLDSATGMDETLAALTDLVTSGKVLAVGSSKFPAADIVEAQWSAERDGRVRLRSEQPTYSMLNRGIERDVLPVTQRHGMGAIVYSPLAQGMLTGRVRRGSGSSLTRSGPWYAHLEDDRRVDAVERIVPIAEDLGVPLAHLAIAFVLAHPGVTAALLGPRTLGQLDDLLAGAGLVLDEDVLDRIDAVVPPGTDVGRLQMSYTPPALADARLRRLPAGERAAA